MVSLHAVVVRKHQHAQTMAAFSTSTIGLQPVRVNFGVKDR
jgi:hypothetical protein